MNNPLLENTVLPQFSKIKPEHIEPAIDSLLAEVRQLVKKQLSANTEYTWENLLEPIENIEDKLNKAWSPIRHMNAVINNDDLRHAYNACLPKLSKYATEMGQNKALFKAYQQIAESQQFSALETAQQKIITNTLRDFRLSGIDLNKEKQDSYQQISLELSHLSSKYAENLLDASNAWNKHIRAKELLSGLPETALMLAKQTAESQQLDGWVFTLQYPSYLPIMTYADNRELRQEFYTAYSTRASNQGPHANQWDNSQIMEQILALRHEKAQLLGFHNYAELSLATKMAGKTKRVTKFLEDLVDKSWRYARKDLSELRQFSKKQYGITHLQAWDIAYFSEKMRQYFYQLSQEELKAYFPISRVIPGLFAVVKKLYGLKITEITAFDSWHPEVRFFQIRDEENQLRGQFYLDLYARENKRGGAWMDDCVGRKKLANKLQIPVAYLTCNFTPVGSHTPALLSHDEVITLFHEFGHGLQHMLTQVDYLGVSGINGVEWDAVELPSQLMENWCWEKETLALISGHYETGEKLPNNLFKKMRAAKNFQAGMSMLRQLEFSLFDFKIHQQYDPAKGGQIYKTLNQIRAQIAVIQTPKFNRFAHSFSHIFAGGYAAGYYSYQWAEVLSSDAFSLFEENGIFDSSTGKSFLHQVLEKGGKQNAMQLFVAFRGREPKIDALLRHHGIAT